MKDIMENNWAIEKQIKFVKAYCDVPLDIGLVSLRKLIKEHLDEYSNSTNSEPKEGCGDYISERGIYCGDELGRGEYPLCEKCREDSTSEEKIESHTKISMNAYDKGILQGRLSILKREHENYHNHYSCGMDYYCCKDSKEGLPNWRYRCKFQGQIREIEKVAENTKEVIKNGR